MRDKPGKAPNDLNTVDLDYMLDAPTGDSTHCRTLLALLQRFSREISEVEQHLYELGWIERPWTFSLSKESTWKMNDESVRANLWPIAAGNHSRTENVVLLPF